MSSLDPQSQPPESCELIPDAPTLEQRVSRLEKVALLRHGERIRTLQTGFVLTVFLAVLSVKVSLTGNRESGFSLELSSRDATELVLAGGTAIAFVLKPDLLPVLLSSLTASGASKK
ncbi:MAG: hypothetical protein RBJ76_13520 [Stenomitos frigidus ULC029]